MQKFLLKDELPGELWYCIVRLSALNLPSVFPPVSLSLYDTAAKWEGYCLAWLVRRAMIPLHRSTQSKNTVRTIPKLYKALYAHVHPY